MDEDRTALPVRIIDENLKLLDSEASSAVERRLAQLSDLATYISGNSSKLLDPDDRMGGLDGLFTRGVIPSEAVDEAVPYLEAYYSSQMLSDKLTVCKFLADRLGWRNDFRLASLLGADSEGFVPLGKDPKIAYLKNAFADDAFLMSQSSSAIRRSTIRATFSRSARRSITDARICASCRSTARATRS